MGRQETEKRPRGRPKSPFTDTSGTTIQALDRGLMVLRTLAEETGQTLSDLSTAVGLPISTLHRILLTLEAQHFARFDDHSQTWSVGVEAFRTGSSFLRQTNLLEAGRPIMRQLMEETGETANMAIRDQDEVVFIGQVETHQPIRAFFRPGARSAMHASGIGKALLAAMPRQEVSRIVDRTGLTRFTDSTLSDPTALLADLDRIRARGWSVDDEERYHGMRCVAATIYDSFGSPVGGISVSGPTARMDSAAIGLLGPLVRRAADGLSERIGGNPSKPGGLD
ncbi:MAG: HTH-type transcriptional regulator BhcR [Qingshengfaniella sp.]